MTNSNSQGPRSYSTLVTFFRSHSRQMCPLFLISSTLHSIIGTKCNNMALSFFLYITKLCHINRTHMNIFQILKADDQTSQTRKPNTGKHSHKILPPQQETQPDHRLTFIVWSFRINFSLFGLFSVYSKSQEKTNYILPLCLARRLHK